MSIDINGFYPLESDTVALQNLICFQPLGPGPRITAKLIEVYDPDTLAVTITYVDPITDVALLPQPGPAELLTATAGQCGKFARARTFAIGGSGNVGANLYRTQDNGLFGALPTLNLAAITPVGYRVSAWRIVVRTGLVDVETSTPVVGAETTTYTTNESVAVAEYPQDASFSDTQLLRIGGGAATGIPTYSTTGTWACLLHVEFAIDA